MEIVNVYYFVSTNKISWLKRFPHSAGFSPISQVVSYSGWLSVFLSPLTVRKQCHTAGELSGWSWDLSLDLNSHRVWLLQIVFRPHECWIIATLVFHSVYSWDCRWTTGLGEACWNAQLVSEAVRCNDVCLLMNVDTGKQPFTLSLASWFWHLTTFRLQLGRFQLLAMHHADTPWHDRCHRDDGVWPGRRLCWCSRSDQVSNPLWS